MMPICRARAPGRVNLIGEHTDYNQGYVLPMAIALETVVAARAREDRVLHARSHAFGGERSLDPGGAPEKGDWFAYAGGVAAQLVREGYTLPGADLEISSTVPVGSGLSSSAAVEIATAFALLALAGEPIDPVAVALLAQRAENAFSGTRSGIMDQFVVANARAGHALFLDTRSLVFEHLALPVEAGVVVCDSMSPRNLVRSGYNARRQECEAAVTALRATYPSICALRDVTGGELAAAKGLEPLLARRARHVISENERVLEAAAALRRRDLPAFGELMNASHASLRDDFEVSTPHLDTLVSLAQQFDGAFGARLTGAGFGGCTVNLVRMDRVDAFSEFLRRAYRERTGIEANVYVSAASAGASILP